MPNHLNGTTLDRIPYAAVRVTAIRVLVARILVKRVLVTSTCLLAAAFLAALNGYAQTSAASAPSPLNGGIFPLEQVQRGLHAVAYTVFEGTQPEAMNVEILGLLHNALGPGKDLILARLQGSKPEYTGVVAGMSGSPVYVDGKLLGALSYRIGEFSKEPIAGITPIAQMLEVRDVPSPEQKHNPGDELPLVTLTSQLQAGESQLSESRIGESQSDQLAWYGSQMQAVSPPDSSQSIGLQRVNSSAAIRPLEIHSPEIRPIETPLVLSGFSPAAVELWQQKMAGSGLTAVAGIGGAAPASGTFRDTAPLLPGSAISAILVRGDLEIAATCTVTYIDPKQLLACGHPITQYGAVSFPMTRAEVLATLASPYNAFKIVNTTDTVGAFTDDRMSAIRGIFGENARMIPVTVAVNGAGVTPGKPRTIRFEVINQAQITPAAVLVSFYQSLMEDNGGGADNTYHVKGAIRIEGFAPVMLDSWVAPTDTLPASLLAALQLGERFTRLYSNATRVNRVTGIELNVDAIGERRQLQIEAAHIGNLNVHAGEQITIEATLRPYRGELRNIRIPVHLPATLPSGSIRMLISDGPTLDRISQPARQSSRPLDINATIAQINGLHNNDSIYVTLLRPEAQAAIDGRTLPSVPLSMANIFEPLRNAQEISLNGESIAPVTSVPVNASLAGQQVIALHVE